MGQLLETASCVRCEEDNEFLLRTGRTEEVERANFAEKYKDLNSPVLLANLEERRMNFDCGVVWEDCTYTNDVVNPNLHRPMRTDLFSLANPDYGEPALDWDELLRAVCGSWDIKPIGSHILLPVKPQRGEFHEGVTFFQEAEHVLPGSKGPQRLCVPIEFLDIQFDWGARRSSQTALSAKDQEKLQRCLKPFMCFAAAGIELQLRLGEKEAEGPQEAKYLEARFSLSRDLERISLCAGGVVRAVPVSTVRSVRPCDFSDQNSDLALSSAVSTSTATTASSMANLSLSGETQEEKERMVVMLLAGGRFLCLRFEHKEQAAYFGTCMKLILKASSKNLGLKLTPAMSES